MFSCTNQTVQGKDFELILTVKIKTRHHIGGPFNCEFSAFVIIAELWRPEVARTGNFLNNFCFLGGKRPLMVNFQNSVRKVYMATPINIIVFKCRKICLMGNRLNHALFTSQKNFGSLSNCRYYADCTQNLRGSAPIIWLAIFQVSFQICSLLGKLQLNGWRPLFCHIEYLQYSPSSE